MSTLRRAELGSRRFGVLGVALVVAAAAAMLVSGGRQAEAVSAGDLSGTDTCVPLPGVHGWFDTWKSCG